VVGEARLDVVAAVERPAGDRAEARLVEAAGAGIRAVELDDVVGNRLPVAPVDLGLPARDRLPQLRLDLGQVADRRIDRAG
jgi:hypothetical protein